MNRIISLGEVRLALRLIVKQPILSVTIIVALATGITVAAVGFTMREEVINGKLPYAAGDRFARVHVINRQGDRMDLDFERYRAVRDQAKSFEYVGAMVSRPFNVKHSDVDVEPVQASILSPGAIRYLETAPL